MLRQIHYGQTAITGRLQRILEVCSTPYGRDIFWSEVTPSPTTAILATGDIDIWVEISRKNAERLAEIRKFGFAVKNLTRELFEKPDQIIRMGIPPMRIEILIISRAWNSRRVTTGASSTKLKASSCRGSPWPTYSKTRAPPPAPRTSWTTNN